MRGVIRGDNYFIDGQQVTKEAFDEAFPNKPIASEAACFFKPIESTALAVKPSQIAEAKAIAESRGVPTDFTPDGRPILRTRAHRKAYLRSRGMFDRSGGYGD